MTTRSTSSRRSGCTTGCEPGPGRPNRTFCAPKPAYSYRSTGIPIQRFASEMWNIHVYTASSAGARCAMLGGGGIGEHEPSAVTGGGGIEEQVTAVFGGGGTDEQDASAMAGGGGIREHEASAVSGGGGIAEHVASAVTGPAGSASTRPARSPAAAGLGNSPAPYSVAAGYLIPNGPGGEPGPTRLGSHRTPSPYPYSAADGPSSHCPGGQKPPFSHTGPSRPAPPACRRCSGPAARHSRFRCVLRPCWPTRRSSSPAASPGISHGPRARSSPVSSADRAVSAMAGARQAPQASGHLPGHFAKAAEAGGLTSGLTASDGDSTAALRYAISADLRGGPGPEIIPRGYRSGRCV